MQHLTPNYIEQAYSHLVENLCIHKTKQLDTSQGKRKRGRPPRPKPEVSNPNPKTATNTHTMLPHQATKILNNEIVSRELVQKINTE